MILTHRENQWLTLTLDRPNKRNALNQKMLASLKQILSDAITDENLRGVSLQGAGGYFSSGIDLIEYAQIYTPGNIGTDNVFSFFELLARFDKPLVAVVEGGARAMGVGLLAACDLVIATPCADFCVNGTAVGLSPLPIVSTMVQKIGKAATRRMLLLSEVIDAAEARHLGIIDYIDENAQAKHEQIKKQFLRIAPETLRRTKRFIAAEEPCYPAIYAKLMSSPEAQEGFASFAEKRMPNWNLTRKNSGRS